MLPPAFVHATTLLVVFFCLDGGGVSAQSPAQAPAGAANPWAPIRFMIGDWHGSCAGDPGEGTGERSYRFEFGETLLRARNDAVYPAQPKNLKGETHRDEGFFSFDKARKRLVFRQFHSEGFVNQYVGEPVPGETAFRFETESIENIPPGWRARETYRLVSADEFLETFELSPPGKPFEIYSQCRLRRIK